MTRGWPRGTPPTGYRSIQGALPGPRRDTAWSPPRPAELACSGRLEIGHHHGTIGDPGQPVGNVAVVGSREPSEPSRADRDARCRLVEGAADHPRLDQRGADPERLHLRIQRLVKALDAPLGRVLQGEGGKGDVPAHARQAGEQLLGELMAEATRGSDNEPRPGLGHKQTCPYPYQDLAVLSSSRPRAHIRIPRGAVA